MEIIPQVFPILLRGLGLTLALAAVIIVCATGLGALLASLSLSHRRVVRVPIIFFSWAMRGIPPLVLLLLAFYGSFVLGWSLTPFAAAVLAMSLSHSAYYMECLRGGLMALPRGPLEAARALAMPRMRTYRRIVLPQLIRIIRPTFLSSTTTLVKNTSIASVIAVPELMAVANKQTAFTGSPFTVLLMAGFFYLVVCSLLLIIGRASSRELAAQ